jgi:transketolase
MGGIREDAYLVDYRKGVDMVPSRDGYGHGLLWLCEHDDRVVVCDADLAKSTRTIWVRDKFPEKFVDFGIAEQDMLAEAGGMSRTGLVPFVTTYGVFVAGRAWDQIRTSICYGNLNVKIGGAHGGISVGPDGPTHQSLEEIPLMRVLPGMTLIVPTDAIEAKKATIWAASHEGPVYLRFGREGVPAITTEETPFTVGRAEVYRDGDDVAIVACGPLVYEALAAADKLEKEGVDARVINCHTIKPLDVDTLLTAAKECGAIVTAEEAQVYGGLGGAVAEVISQRHPVPMRIVGIEDVFGESGSPRELLDKYGMNSENIVAKVKEVLEMKK